MLETIITTSDALRYALAMSTLALVATVALVAVNVYLMIEWRRDLDGLKAYLESRGITDKED